jgi:hypothetical protein
LQAHHRQPVFLQIQASRSFVPPSGVTANYKQNKCKGGVITLRINTLNSVVVPPGTQAAIRLGEAWPAQEEFRHQVTCGAEAAGGLLRLHAATTIFQVIAAMYLFASIRDIEFSRCSVFHMFAICVFLFAG